MLGGFGGYVFPFRMTGGKVKGGTGQSRDVKAHPGLVGHEQVLLAGLAQDLAEHLDGLAAGEQEGHGNASHARHLHIVVHVHQLVHQALWQVRVLQRPPCISFAIGCIGCKMYDWSLSLLTKASREGIGPSKWVHQFLRSQEISCRIGDGTVYLIRLQ